MKDLPGKEEHPLLCFDPDHQEEGGEQPGEGQDQAAAHHCKRPSHRLQPGGSFP